MFKRVYFIDDLCDPLNVCTVFKWTYVFLFSYIVLRTRFVEQSEKNY